MPVTIDSLFGFQNMGQSVQLFAKPPQALRGTELFTPEPCENSDVYRFDREDFEMSLPPFVAGRKEASKAVKTEDKKVEFIGLAHIRVHKVLHAADLFTSRVPGEISDNAAAMVARARQSLLQRIRLGIERLCWMALRGEIVVNATNFPDTVAALTVTRAVTTLTAQSASWATNTTKIVSDDVQDWRRDLENATGFKLGRLMFSRLVTGYLLNNTEIQAWITQTQRGVNTFETAMFERMGGIEKWEEYDGWYKPEGGSVTRFLVDKEVFALPEDGALAQIARLVEGRGEIPTQAIGAPGGGGLVGATPAPNTGIFEYAVPIGDGDPPGIKIVAGWYGIPILKVPTAIGYEADVTA